MRKLLLIIEITVSISACMGISYSPLHKQRDIQEVMLDLWSQLDLMQAITLTPEQQELFINTLAYQALDLYVVLHTQQHEDNTKLPEYYHLCMTLRTTSAQLFSAASTPAVHALLFVLDTLITQLETPSNITGERSTQQISLKHVFTP